jgi:hypothetical protein
MRFAVLTLAVAIGPALAQDLLWQAQGLSGQTNRGIELARLGDFNGDSHCDILEMGESVYMGYRRLIMRVISGSDGSILTQGYAVPFYWNMQNATAAGDINADGYLDYASYVYDAANPVPTQTLGVFSGLDHTTIWTAQIPSAWGTNFAKVLCGDLDTNGDGRRDIVTTAYTLSPLGTIIVYDHAGVERYRVVDPISSFPVGLDIANLGGDLDGDGCDDFLCSGLDPTARGAIVVFSGRTGSVIQISYGAQPGDGLVNVGACGDVDRDGVPDYCGGGSVGASVVTAFSGATGQIIHSWRDNGISGMGRNCMGGFDLDQDGIPDLAAGSTGRMNVFSGRDGTFLWTFYGSYYPSDSGAGVSLTMLPAAPGDQYPLFVFSEWRWSSLSNPCGSNQMCPGIVYCYRGAPRTVRAYGFADTSGLQPFARSGMRRIPQTVGTNNGRLRFTISEAPPGAGTVLMLGTSNTTGLGAPLPVGLDPLGLPGITLWQSAQACMLTVASSTGLGPGYAAFDITLPLTSQLGPTGTPFYAQWVWFDPANLQNHGSTAGQQFRLQ